MTTLVGDVAIAGRAPTRHASRELSALSAGEEERVGGSAALPAAGAGLGAAAHTRAGPRGSAQPGSRAGGRGASSTSAAFERRQAIHSPSFKHPGFPCSAMRRAPGKPRPV